MQTVAPEPRTQWWRRLAWLAVLIGAATVPLAVLVFATVGGRDQVVDLSTVVVAAAAGGLVGTVVAGVLEYDTLRQLSVAPMPGVGLIEEASKLIVPVAVLLLSTRARDVRAGTALGVASGMHVGVVVVSVAALLWLIHRSRRPVKPSPSQTSTGPVVHPPQV
ncbi:hypothetical protein [Aestuariimicrobium ganziense]|uniref:hypothetical protein n=1 Tax=Aestuariimicrobium ganziense TaxID=2773677 RepID=UPI001940B425|nr:hypothetical protein [Aestuariimicrobium ganziense]